MEREELQLNVSYGPAQIVEQQHSKAAEGIICVILTV